MLGKIISFKSNYSSLKEVEDNSPVTYLIPELFKHYGIFMVMTARRAFNKINFILQEFSGYKKKSRGLNF